MIKSWKTDLNFEKNYKLIGPTFFTESHANKNEGPVPDHVITPELLVQLQSNEGI